MIAIVALALLGVGPGEPESVRQMREFRDTFVEINPDSASGLAPFQISKYEVTQQLYESLTGKNPSRWKGPRNSLELLTYEEAQRFCILLTSWYRVPKDSDQDIVVRLPTEAEWEYSCRAGTTTKYSFGDDPAKLGDYAWFHGNAAGNDPPVGAKKPNPLGLYDMHGYLWEMCSGSEDPSKIILRGGSWKDNAELLTSASRRVVSSDIKDDAVGFRCVIGKLPKSLVAFEDAKPLAQDDYVSADAKFEVVWGEGEFTEGPALGPDGLMYFSDIGNRIYRFDPISKKTDIYRDPSGRSNGLIFDRDGRLYAAEGANTGGARRISVTEMDGKIRTLADKYEGKKFNSPNDLAVDAKGNVFFSDPRYGSEEDLQLGYECVFHISPEGKVKIATRDVEKPNGIVLSSDGKTCYVADNNPKGQRVLLKFKVGEDGTLTDKQLLHDFGKGRGIDGMTVDKSGTIYATAGSDDKAGIWVFDPKEGSLLAWIATPGDPTNCEFGGGKEKNVLYVTTALPGKPTKYGLARIKLRKEGR